MLTLENSPVRNRDARPAMLPCASTRGHIDDGAAGVVLPLPPLLLPSSETPRLCADASLKQKTHLEIPQQIKFKFSANVHQRQAFLTTLGLNVN